MAARTLTLLVLTASASVSIWAQAVAQQKTFDSPEAAMQALIDAAGKNDTAQLSALFGPNAKQILTSGDVQKDKAERQEFSELATRKHELQASTMNPNVRIMIVGAEDWPFPVPIVQKAGKWRFETAQGAIEMRARRIGANELDAIEICAGYVEAQQTYASQVRDKHGVLEYAQQLMSSPGEHDGLYWKGEGALVPEGFAEAESHTGGATEAKALSRVLFPGLEVSGRGCASGPA